MRSETKKRSGWMLVLNTLIVLGVLAIGLLVRGAVYEPAVVTSGSMKNTIAVGDKVLVDHRAGLSGRWQRGDIVFFKAPPTWGGDDEALVKRVIGLPGETVIIREGIVYINDQRLIEPYLAEPSEPDFMKSVKLGDDEYFVCGDNRNESDDSRTNGPVANPYIRGRIVMRIAPLAGFGRFARPNYEF